MFAEWFVALVTLLISIVFYVQARHFPHMAADPGGLCAFPQTLSVISALAALALIARLLREGATTRQWRALADWPRFLVRPSAGEVDARRLFLQTLVVFTLSLAYPWLILKLGFLVGTGLFCFLLLATFGTPLLKNALVSVGVTVVIYAFFMGIIGVPGLGGDWMGMLFE